MIRQWMQHRDYVFPGLGNFIQIEHCTAPHRPRDRTVLPHGITALHQIPSEQICCRRIFMTGHRDERSAQSMRHVLDKAALATASRSLDQKRESLGIGMFEDSNLLTNRTKVRRSREHLGITSGLLGNHVPHRQTVANEVDDLRADAKREQTCGQNESEEVNMQLLLNR